jgi:hypothetical protein
VTPFAPFASVRRLERAFRRRESPSTPPPPVYRGQSAVYRAVAAVSRPAAGSARSRSAGAANRARVAIYRGEAGGIPRTCMIFFHLCSFRL